MALIITSVACPSTWTKAAMGPNKRQYRSHQNISDPKSDEFERTNSARCARLRSLTPFRPSMRTACIAQQRRTTLAPRPLPPMHLL